MRMHVPLRFQLSRMQLTTVRRHHAYAFMMGIVVGVLWSYYVLQA